MCALIQQELLAPPPWLRTAVGRRMGRLFGGDRYPQEQYTRPAGDPGLFGPASVTWKVHAHPAMIVGGMSAVILQSLHPLAMAGVAQHSNWRQRPLARLSRTSSFVVATTYGSTPVAESVIEVVKAVHTRVVGTTADGRPYAAGHPDLLAWVHTAEVVSFLRSYQRYELLPLSGRDADRYLREVSVVAERLGAPSVPRSRAELDAYLEGVRPELVAGEEALDTVAFLMSPPSRDPAVRTAYGLVMQAAVGLLPGWARAMLGLRHSTLVEHALVRPAAWSLVHGLRLAVGPPAALHQARARCHQPPEQAAA